MANAKKLPSGKWRCLVTCDGERRSFTAYTKKEAEFLALEWQTGRKDKRNPDNLTVGEMVERYIESREGVIEETTITAYRTILNNNLCDIKDIKVSNLTDYEVQKWVSKLSKQLSPKTVHNIYGLFKSAVKIDFDVALPKKAKLSYKTPDIDTCAKIIQAVQGSEVEVPVLLAMWCSLRMSEVRGIRWDRVREDRIIIDTAHIHMGGKDIVKGTKTLGSQREIFIHPYLYERIKAVPRTSEWVVPYAANTINRKFKKLLHDNDIPGCRFHDLRHANASIMLLLNIPDKYAMERGGWTTTDVLKNVYQQTHKNESIKFADKINDFFMDTVINAHRNAHENAHEDEKDLLN